MVKSAIWYSLDAKEYKNLIGKKSKELELRNQKLVNHFMETKNPIVLDDACGSVY